MTTTFPTDNRNILNEADATTGWTATDGPVVFTASPDPIEAGACLGFTASNAVEDAYVGITSDNYSNGGTLSIWIQDRAEFQSTVNTGIGIVVGDGTNRIAYAVGGSDGTAFRHDTGPVKWANFVLDLANKPANFVAITGSEANLNEAAITQVGIYVETLVKSVGGADNVFWDIIRFADNGDDVIIQGGATSGAAGNGAEAAVVDRSTGNQQAYGVIRELGAGLYGIQGNLTIGNAASSSNQYWAETNVTYAWEDRNLSTNNYYRFKLIGSSTATNCEFDFNACTFTVPSAASASYDGNGADITVCDIINSAFIGFDQGIETSGLTSADWTGCTFINNGQVVANGCDLSSGNIRGYEGTAGTSALTYNLAVDPDGELDNMTFTKGTAATHALEFGASVPTTMTLRGCTFSGYNAADGNNDSTFHFLDTSGTSITLNLISCSGNFTYTTDGADITIVSDPITVSVTVLDNLQSPLLGARVILEASNGTGDLPYLETPTSITRSGTTATVTLTAHGVATGKKVAIRGATDTLYNGVFTITSTGANTFEYTMSGTPAANATGTLTVNGVMLEGTTDSSGYIADSRTLSNPQPLVGRISKGSASPIFKDFPLSGTASTTVGASFNAQLVLDE